MFSVFERKTGAFLGEAGLGGIRGAQGDGEKGRHGDAGIVLGQEATGKGYAVEALEAIFSWVFHESGPSGDEVRVCLPGSSGGDMSG